MTLSLFYKLWTCPFSSTCTWQQDDQKNKRLKRGWCFFWSLRMAWILAWCHTVPTSTAWILVWGHERSYGLFASRLMPYFYNTISLWISTNLDEGHSVMCSLPNQAHLGHERSYGLFASRLMPYFYNTISLWISTNLDEGHSVMCSLPNPAHLGEGHSVMCSLTNHHWV